MRQRRAVLAVALAVLPLNVRRPGRGVPPLADLPLIDAIGTEGVAPIMALAEAD